MAEIIWAVHESKRDFFNLEYSEMIKRIPNEFWKDKNYMPSWCSELPFPLFHKEFINNLPSEYVEKIRSLYESIIVK